MMNDTMMEALNRQLNEEIYNSNFYLALSAYLDERELRGMASWMRAQAKGEQEHVHAFYNYITDRGGAVKVTDIPGPPNGWKTIKEVFRNALEREQAVTRQIGDLVHKAQEHGDHCTHNFLQKLIEEQTEEEAELRTIVGQLALAGETGNGVLMLDRELSKKS